MVSNFSHFMRVFVLSNSLSIKLPIFGRFSLNNISKYHVFDNIVLYERMRLFEFVRALFEVQP